jgi:hypothetical protein
MKCNYLLLLVLCVALSGCGVDWFPASTSSGGGSDGSTLTAPTVRAALSPTTIASGGSSTLTLTILNKTGNPAQSGLQFQEALPAGVTASGAVSNCGGTVETTSSFLIFRNGVLASGAASCTITANLGATNTGTGNQSFVIKSADFTNLLGGLVSGVTDQTLTVTPAAAVPSSSLSVLLDPAAMLDGGSVALKLTLANSAGNPAQSGIGFSQTLPAGFQATVTNSTQCGGTLAASGSALTFTGGQLASGEASCTLSANLSLTASNTITADRTVTIKSTDFSGLLGALNNGVTDQSFKVFPSAITSPTGGVTVSNLVAAGLADGTQPSVNFTFEANTASSNASAVNAIVTVAAVDKTGATIAATQTPLSVSIPTGLLTTQLPLNATLPVSVSDANNANIIFWRLLTVTVN